MYRTHLLMAAVMVLVSSALRAADPADPKIQAKVNAALKEAQVWATDAIIVDAVKEANANPSDAAKQMTQEKWKELSVTDPFVRALASNAAARFLKSKKGEFVSEAFVSAADGTKVCLLSKTTSWSHKGKAKHDHPMQDKTWQGEAELDASTGVQQIQIAVPVKDGETVIGSMVIGLNVTKMKE